MTGTQIAINLRAYFKGKIGGLENIVREVIGPIGEEHHKTGGTVTVFADASQINSVREFLPSARFIPIREHPGLDVVRAELQRQRYDLLLCPLTMLEPAEPGIPSVVWIPDIQHEFHPENFTTEELSHRTRAYRDSAINADAIFTISEHAKRTIVDRYRVSSDKVHVTPPDVGPEFQQTAAPETISAFDDLGLPKDYIYFPANFWRHKNHINLLRAVRILADERNGLCLVLSGAPSTGAERVEEEVQRLNLEPHVRILEYQPRSVVVEIFRNARALAFASQYEGFGIPILEAFHARIPVVTSRSTACPEVAGGAALLVDPDEPNDIATAIRRVLDEPRLRAELVAAGAKQIERFSWQKTIDDTLSNLRRLQEQTRSVSSLEVRERPIVTVVTPSYNMAPFIEETIQSVLSQDYPHLDYIIMDGGSTDETPQILAKYRDRVRVRSGPDAGQSAAINEGFSMAKGEIFAFLNADDTYLPGAVGTAVDRLLDSPAAGAVYGEAYYVNRDSERICAYPTLPFDRATLSRNCYICQPASFFWKRVFTEAGGFDTELQCSFDYDFWIRVSKRHPLLKIEDYLATSRMHDDNKTTRDRKTVYQETMRVVRRHYGYVPFDWAFGYATYLANPKAGFFESQHATRRHYLLALVVGLYQNRYDWRRFVSEWGESLGLHRRFTGHWEDGWISRRYRTELEPGDEPATILVKGTYPEFLPKGLTLTLYANGESLGQRRLNYGDFEIALPFPGPKTTHPFPFEIQCNQTFRPIWGGDFRRLGCQIDSVACR